MLSSSLLTLFGTFAGVVAAALKATGSTVELNGIDYFVPPDSVGSFSAHSRVPTSPHALAPLTVITTASVLDQASLNSIAADYTARDDVWQQGFLEGTCVATTMCLPSYATSLSPCPRPCADHLCQCSTYSRILRRPHGTQPPI